VTAYGTGDATYVAVGGEAGIARLVATFYGYMATLAEATRIRDMHEVGFGQSPEKLRVFLCAWLGGPNQYRERFGPISIPGVHAHLAIDEAERDAWLTCMRHAVADQPWPEDLARYFMHAISVPADRVRVTSQARRAR
jgi:hemoglobin